MIMAEDFDEWYPSLRSKTFDIDWSYQKFCWVKKGVYPKGYFVKRSQVEKFTVDLRTLHNAMQKLVKERTGQKMTPKDFVKELWVKIYR